MARVPPTVDRASFAAFVERHRADLVRTACRIAGDSAEAEDVVQDTLVAMWQRWQSPAARQSVGLRVSGGDLERHQTPDAAAAGGPAGAAGDLTAPVRGRTARPVGARAGPRPAAAAQQVIVRMRFYLGLSLAQIGRNLSISSNTAASRCRYALATLRKALSGPRHSAGPGKETHHGNERGTQG